MCTVALQYTKMNQAHVNGIIMINLQPGAVLNQAHINGINIINLQPGAVLKQRNWSTTVWNDQKKGFLAQADLAGFYTHTMTTINSNGIYIKLLLSVPGRARSGGAMQYKGTASHWVALHGVHDQDLYGAPKTGM